MMKALTSTVWIFVAGSAMVSISIALNALSLHGTCTAVFVAVAAIIDFLFSSIQTLHRISWLAWVGVVGIISSSKPSIECLLRYHVIDWFPHKSWFLQSPLASKTAPPMRRRQAYFNPTIRLLRAPAQQAHSLRCLH